MNPRPRIAWVCAAAALFAGCTRDGDGGIEGTGTLELVEADISPTAAARVEEVRVEEGQAVRAGDTVAVLRIASLGAQIEQQTARSRTASAQLRQLERGSRAEDVRYARSVLDAAEAEAAQTARELTRGQALEKGGVISRQELDAIQSAARAAAARRDAVRAEYERVRNGARAEDIEAARAEVAGAAAGERAVRATASDLVLVAPFDGIVASRNAEPGEVLAPGQSVVTVGRASRPWVRVYLGQGAVARVRVGQRATGRLDDFPEREFQGRVVAINTSAEFTPRVALTEQERADMLFGVKVEFEDSTGMLKGGLPITVRLAPQVVARP